MAVATSTAILIASVVTAAAATGQAVQANQARQEAKGAANEQKEKMKQASDAAASASEAANNLSTANLMRDAAKKRQQSVMGNNAGVGSTILTGGLGVSQQAQSAQKPLLGQ